LHIVTSDSSAQYGVRRQNGAIRESDLVIELGFEAFVVPRRRRQRNPALVIFGLLVFGGNGFAGAVGILSGVVTVATIGTVALGVVDQGEANVRAVTGAVCVYVLIGLLFVFLYGAIAKLGSGDFFAQGTDGTRSLRLYFSFVTLATLGYGDYTPAGSLGRTLAIVEALFGQLYLVTVIAVLVSRMRRASPSS